MRGRSASRELQSRRWPSRRSTAAAPHPQPQPWSSCWRAAQRWIVGDGDHQVFPLDQDPEEHKFVGLKSRVWAVSWKRCCNVPAASQETCVRRIVWWGVVVSRWMNCWRRNSRCSVRSSDGESWGLFNEGSLVSAGGSWLLPLSKAGCWGASVPDGESIWPVERGVRRRVRKGVLKIETQINMYCFICTINNYTFYLCIAKF